MLSSNSRFSPARTLALAAGSLLALSAHAADYNVKHSFVWFPCSTPTIAAASHVTFASARTTRCRDWDLDSPPIVLNSIAPGSTFNSVWNSSAAAGGSSADARAQVAVTSVLSSGRVTGFIQNSGNTFASSQNCNLWWPWRIRFGTAASVSWSGVKLFQSNFSSCGAMQWLGSWTNKSFINQGGASAKIVIDPIIGTIKHNDGTSQSWKFLTVKSTVSGGETTWREIEDPPGSGFTRPVLDNTSPDMDFEVLLDVPQSSGQNLQGTYRIVVKNGVLDTTLTQATGFFLSNGAVLPTAATFTMLPFPAIAFPYNMGATLPTDEVIIGIDGGGEEATDPEASCFGWDNEISSLGEGFNLAPTSMPDRGDGSLGFECTSGTLHVADDFTASNNPTFLDYVSVPYFQAGSTAASDLSAAYVRIWSGTPGSGGTIFAGDLVTNRLIDIQDSDEVNVYRVSPNMPTDSSRPIRHALINLADIAPLPPGPYYLELALVPATGAAPAEVLPLPAKPTDNAMISNGSLITWYMAQDSLSNRLVDFNFHIVCRDAPPCIADFNQDANLDFFDYLDFVDVFSNGGEQADFNIDGTIDFFDYLDFVDAFSTGC